MLASYRIPAARIRADLAQHHHKATVGLSPGGVFIVLQNAAALQLREAFFIAKNLVRPASLSNMF
jgi:hypothetical protein